MTPLYSVGTWDTEVQGYTPHEGLGVPMVNVDVHGLRRALKALRNEGYTCHRFKHADDSDTSVLVERTDGAETEAILKAWER